MSYATQLDVMVNLDGYEDLGGTLRTDLRAGRGRLVLVTGERGAGLTHRATRLLRHIAGDDDLIVADMAAMLDARSRVRGAPAVAVADPGSGAVEIVVRALAKVRTDGPAARLIAELQSAPGSAPANGDEFALALLRDARLRTVAVLLETVDLTSPVVSATLEQVCAVVAAGPIVVVATVPLGGRDPSSLDAWRSWLGRAGVLHLPVGPLDHARSEIARVALTAQRLPSDVVDSIAEVCRGNPRIGQEFVLWTAAGEVDDALPPDGVIRALVRDLDEHGVLAALAVVGLPLRAAQLAGMSTTSVHRTLEVLAAAVDAAVVRREGAPGPMSVYRLAHPVFAAALRPGPLNPRRALLHRWAAAQLVADCAANAGADADGSAPAEGSSADLLAPQVARHLIASGMVTEQNPRWCLFGADRLARDGDLDGAVELATAGLGCRPGAGLSAQLTLLLAAAQRRRGELRSALTTLRTGLTAAQEHLPERVLLAVELLELEHITGSAPGFVQLSEVVDDCPEERPDLKLRLAALQAVATPAHDPQEGQRLRAAVVLTKAPTPQSQARALATVASAYMAPDEVVQLDRLASRLVSLEQQEGLTAASGAALATGARGRVDHLLREYTWREQRTPDATLRDEIVLLEAVLAALSGHPEPVQRALRVSRSPNQAAAASAQLLPFLWAVNTRGVLPGGRRALMVRSGPGLYAELEHLGWLLLRSGALGARDLTLARERLEVLADLDPAQHSAMTSLRLAAGGLIGALGGDRSLCEAAADGLVPYAEQFLMVWPYLPVGPAGWFAAKALQALGRHRQAAASLDAALHVSVGLGAPGWVLRVAAEQARYLPDRPDVAHVLRTSVGAVTATRFPRVLAEIRRLPVIEQKRVFAVPKRAMSTALPSQSDPSNSPVMTEREREIMSLASQGYTNQQIAGRLFLSVTTIERHCTTLYRRLGVRNRAQALSLIGPLADPDTVARQPAEPRVERSAPGVPTS